MSISIALGITATGCASSEPASVAPASTAAASAPRPVEPRFNATGEFLPPKDYRTWTFLTSGFSMAYGPAAQAMAESGMHVLDIEAQEAAGRNPEALAAVDRALGLLARDESLNPSLRERLERGLRERRTRLTRPWPDPKPSGQ